MNIPVLKHNVRWGQITQQIDLIRECLINDYNILHPRLMVHVSYQDLYCMGDDDGMFCVEQ